MNLKKILFIILISLMNSSCAIFNSGTVHIKYTDVRANFNEVPYKNVEKWGNISASIRGVQHPETYGNWAMNLMLSPSIHYDRQAYATTETFVTPQGQTQTHPDMKQSRLSVLGNLKLTAHTPIGAFSLSGGFGEGLVRIKGGETRTMKTTQIRKIDFVYVAFLTRRIFLLAGPRYYRESHDEFVMAVRVGYFWGKP